MAENKTVEPFEHLHNMSQLEKLWWAEAEIERLGRKLVKIEKEKNKAIEALVEDIEARKKKYNELEERWFKMLKTNIGDGKK